MSDIAWNEDNMAWKATWFKYDSDEIGAVVIIANDIYDALEQTRDYLDADKKGRFESGFIRSLEFVEWAAIQE